MIRWHLVQKLSQKEESDVSPQAAGKLCSEPLPGEEARVLVPLCTTSNNNKVR